MTRTEKVELIFEQRTHRFLRSVRIASAVWQARAAPGVAPVGRRSLAHLALSPRRALLALQPRAFGALGRLAPLVGLPALAAPGWSADPEKGRVTRERPAVRVACGIFPGTPQEKGPSMSLGPRPSPTGAPPSAPATRPLGPGRTVLVRSTSSGSVRACSPYAQRRVAAWVALPLGPERAAPRGRHCHSALSAPSRYARRRVAVWSALPLGPERAAPRGRHCHSSLDAPFHVVGTATRPWTYRLGTLDVEWQCGRHCHSALSVQSRVVGTATRA